MTGNRATTMAPDPETTVQTTAPETAPETAIDRELAAALAAELAAQDGVLWRRGLEIWIGAEPTFTRRQSQEPWWLSQAEGGEKEERARALLAALARRLPTEAELGRAAGRQFPGEAAPRFAWGARWPRRGTPMAALSGSPDMAWLTVTPDPGVVEVNMAPCPGAAAFLAHASDIYAAADEAGLSPLRYRYNGDLSDSGGGGQLTLGGPTPAQSPFFLHPHLLPGLVAYLNNHPALSYWFAGECVGSASQGPRPDEGVRERWEELGVTLAWLHRLAARGALGPAQLWQALGPLLVDASGNSHRAEANVEKLWNPWLGDGSGGADGGGAVEGGARRAGTPGARGMLGVVELRSLRMPPRPTLLAATAALFRAVAARCALAPYRAPLIDWGRSLHDRFAVPAFLRADLERVLADLEASGVGIGPAARAELLSVRGGAIATDASLLPLRIERGLEFWPLVGDVASQERATARVVDASVERVVVSIVLPAGATPAGATPAGAPSTGAAPAAPPELHAAGTRIELTRSPLPSRDGSITWVAALRRRVYEPSPGFHPGLPATDPLALRLVHGDRAITIELYGWKPGGGGYDGLPADAAAAAERRAERVVVSPVHAAAASADPDAAAPLRRAIGWTVDLRLDPADLADPAVRPAASPAPIASPAPSPGTEEP